MGRFAQVHCGPLIELIWHSSERRSYRRGRRESASRDGYCTEVRVLFELKKRPLDEVKGLSKDKAVEIMRQAGIVSLVL
jgi:hypothetical protein